MIVTREILTKAVARSSHLKGLDDMGRETLVDLITDYMGFSRYVLDNILTTDERKCFSEACSAGLLISKTEEIYILRVHPTHYLSKNKQQRFWTIHSYEYNEHKINRLLNKGKEVEQSDVKEDIEDTYQNLPDAAWVRAED